MDKNILKLYADIAVKLGVSIIPGDEVVIAADAECHEFVEIIAKSAYLAGAKKVTPLFSSEKIMRLRYENESPETLTDIADWVVECRNYAAEKGAAYISVVSGDPEAYMGLDINKITAYSRIYRSKLEKFYEATMNNNIRWTIVAYPGKAWSNKVFPNDDNAQQKLFNLITKAMRLDRDDPVSAWQEHCAVLKTRREYLNAAKFKALRYKNSLGTDFYVELPENYVFLGGQEYSSKGVLFMANLPTEEIFSAPHKYSAKGRLVSSMPLVHHGSKVENFTLDFIGGRIVKYSAERGQDVLAGIIETDEGSAYLGEIAIVPFDSPIQKMGTVFFNTLYDENASCHFAIGKAYPCIENAENLSQQELADAGLNHSIEHVDFMVGTSDLKITGIKHDGTEVVFFQDGNFVKHI